MSFLPERKGPYYYINETPRGFVVACAAHIVTEEVKEDEARALVAALNADYRAISIGDYNKKRHNVD